GMRGESSVEALRAVSQRRVPLAMSIEGGGPEKARVICGFLGCDARPFNPLLATLPRVIHLRARPADDVLRSLVELAVIESAQPRPGGDCALSRLSELLFVEVVRRYVAQLPPGGVGWFAGLRDENVGRALQKLHQRPTHDWSLEGLAKECGLSRSVLAERFAHLVGVPPIQYLAKWRIQLAASLLRSGKSSLAEIADQVGYGSEAALSRAFKRQVGIAPALYRRAESA
ncbi:MAG TPA: AraC family transcriptional regulator, partial [Polyangiaceae bacterium]|nr:AraC family transcriptional regulator [Polyangiaceae bacterium]